MSNQPLTEAEIKTFVTAWYLALDQHAPAEECLKLVADDVQMIFPEKTLHGRGDFAAWYAGGAYADGEQAPGVINIFFDENHNVVSVASEISGAAGQAARRCRLAGQLVRAAGRQEQARVPGRHPGLGRATFRQERLRDRSHKLQRDGRALPVRAGFCQAVGPFCAGFQSNQTLTQIKENSDHG